VWTINGKPRPVYVWWETDENGRWRRRYHVIDRAPKSLMRDALLQNGWEMGENGKLVKEKSDHEIQTINIGANNSVVKEQDWNFQEQKWEQDGDPLVMGNEVVFDKMGPRGNFNVPNSGDSGQEHVEPEGEPRPGNPPYYS